MTHNKTSQLIKFFILLASTTLIEGCSLTKQSLVSSSLDFKPMSDFSSSAQGAEKIKYKIGLVLNKAMEAEVAKCIAQQGGLIYDFEFKVGRDIQDTLPVYLNSFVNTVPIKSIGDGDGYDFILDPKITSSLSTHIGQSAAPRYELSITLDMSVIKNGIIKERFTVRKDSHVEISAWENQDVERTATMKKVYEAQIASIYNELGVLLNGLFRKR